MGAYSVVFAPSADQVLAKLPLTVRGEIRHRMSELALVADAVASGLEGDPAPTGDRPGTTYAFEIAGVMISYVVTDASRTVTVLSVVRL